MLNLSSGNPKKRIVEKEEYGHAIGLWLDLRLLPSAMSTICVTLVVDSLTTCVH